MSYTWLENEGGMKSKYDNGGPAFVITSCFDG